MTKIEYMAFGEVAASEFIPLLNKNKVRKHLINHELFDADSVERWIGEKVELDAIEGCKVRAILVDTHLAGWCGIQLEQGMHEIAIVLDDVYWGLGIQIFNEVMTWAKRFGHETVFIHFLDTRPEYRFLRKIATRVFASEFLGNTFTTYEVRVQ